MDELRAVWLQFEALKGRILAYLKSSETEFAGLIGALDTCWTMTENLRAATGRLEALTAGSSHTDAMRQSMSEGCAAFRIFLTRIVAAGERLAASAAETRAMLATTGRLQAEMAPLHYLAFHFRLEGARLSLVDRASIAKVYEEMQEVLASMKHSGDSQANTLDSVLKKLGAATQSVEQISLHYARRAADSEIRIQQNLELLSQASPELIAVRDRAVVVSAAVDTCIRNAVRVLQGHDSIRQRVEHILGAIAGVHAQESDSVVEGHDRRSNEAGHTLALEREQARRVLEALLHIGSSIQRELNGVAGTAQAMIEAGVRQPQPGGSEVDRFEDAVDHLASLRSEVTALLAGEVEMGRMVLSQIEPICALLVAKSDELEALARSMKRLALNVLIGASQMPSAKGIDALGAWTSDASGRVLQLARMLNSQFAALGASLDAQATQIHQELKQLEACRQLLSASPEIDAALRHSRRAGFEEVAQLGRESAILRQETETLLQSLRFVDEGNVLFKELDDMLGNLLALYPEPEHAFDAAAASAGYTMREQHEVHAGAAGTDGLLSTDEAKEPGSGYARLAAVKVGEDYGANIELF